MRPDSDQPVIQTSARNTGNTLRSRTLAKGIVWSLFGQGIPLVVALAAIPMLFQGYGADRFGILALVWAAIGYFSLFDLGMSRALTQRIASSSNQSGESEIGPTIWAALAIMGLLGIVGGVFLAAITPWLVERVLTMPGELVDEARTGFLLVAISIPFLTFSQALRGILEAHLRFDVVNAVRIPLGSLSMIGPLFVLPFSNSLIPAVAIIVLSRAIGGAIYLKYCLRVQPALRARTRILITTVLPLVRFGSWMTISNVIGPLMVYFDRFLIGSLVSVAAAAYYAAPYDLVTRLWIVPGAFCMVLFPAFAASAKSDAERTIRLYLSGLKYSFILLFPLIFLTVIFAPDLLRLWISADFASESATVLRILALGVMVNSLAQVAFALVQGLGRADITAKLHLSEIPFYFVLLWFGVASYGIKGAAMAWTIRVTVDAVLLFVATVRLANCPVIPLTRLALMMAGGGTLAAIICIVESIGTRIVLSVALLSIFLVLSWIFALSADERRFLKLRRPMK